MTNLFEDYELDYYKIDYTPVVFNDSDAGSTTLYLFSTLGTYEFRREAKRYFWSKLIYKVSKGLSYATATEFARIRDFLKYVTWIDSNDIYVDHNGVLVTPPPYPIMYELFKRYNILEATDRRTRRIIDEASSTNIMGDIPSLPMTNGNTDSFVLSEPRSNLEKNMYEFPNWVLYLTFGLFLIIFASIVILDFGPSFLYDSPSIYSHYSDAERPYLFDHERHFKSKRAIRR